MTYLDPHKTALIVIDPQNWTLALPIAPHTREAVVDNAFQLARSLSLAGGIIIFTKAVFSQGYVDMLRQPVDMPLNLPAGGIPAAEEAFDTRMQELDVDIVIPKRQWSGFYGTELDLQLRRRGVTTTIICGIMTNFGVESTARDAWQHNYTVIVADDACSSLSGEMHNFSVEKILPRVAQIGHTKNILESFFHHANSPNVWNNALL